MDIIGHRPLFVKRFLVFVVQVQRLFMVRSQANSACSLKHTLFENFLILFGGNQAVDPAAVKVVFFFSDHITVQAI